MPDYFQVALSAILAVNALFIFGIGLRGLVTRRPFLLSSRWFYAIFLLSILPQAIFPLVQAFSGRAQPSMSDGLFFWLILIVFVALAGYLALAMRGYIAIGVTQESMRQGLFASLDELQMPYKESIGSVELIADAAELEVAIQGWIGTGQVRPANVPPRHS